MFIGDTSYPNNFGFIIERMEGWEDRSFINGLMFLMINDELYPKYVRTTTFNCELDELLDDDSPLIRPVVDKKLYQLDDAELLKMFVNITYPDIDDDDDIDNDYSYLLPFHEINDDGWSIFIISDGENIKLFVYDRRDQYPDVKLHDTLEIPAEKYFKTINELKKFYNDLLNEWR